jgi:hypothetical protein
MEDSDTFYEIKRRSTSCGVNRTVTFRGTQYDFSDRPLAFGILMGVSASALVAIPVLALLILHAMMPGVTDSLTAHIPYLLGAGLFWIALGLVKLMLTGTARPFFTVDITTRSESTPEDAP